MLQNPGTRRKGSVAASQIWVVFPFLCSGTNRCDSSRWDRPDLDDRLHPSRQRRDTDNPCRASSQVLRVVRYEQIGSACPLTGSFSVPETQAGRLSRLAGRRAESVFPPETGPKAGPPAQQGSGRRFTHGRKGGFRLEERTATCPGGFYPQKQINKTR